MSISDVKPSIYQSGLDILSDLVSDSSSSQAWYPKSSSDTPTAAFPLLNAEEVGKILQRPEIKGDIAKIPSNLQESIRNFGPAIRSLDLRDCHITKEKLDALILYFPNITRLILKGAVIDDIAISELQRLPLLEELDLERNNTLTNSGVLCVSQLKHLKTLNLSCCANMTDADMRAIAKIQTLQNLSMRDLDLVTEKGVHHLLRLRKLTTLDVRGNLSIKGKWIKKLPTACPQLRELYLTGCYNLYPAYLTTLAGLPLLRKVYIEKTLLCYISAKFAAKIIEKLKPCEIIKE